MKASVKNLDNKIVKEIELPETVFGYPFKEHLIHTVVRSILASQRAGTSRTKVRSEVSGSGRKLWRQKGTGRARVGSLRSPLWRKGGVVHGPRSKTYDLRVSVRDKKNALKSALSQKLADGQLLILESFELKEHKTSALCNNLRGLGVDNKALLVDSSENEYLHLASRNRPELKAVDVLGVNVYDVIDRQYIVVSERALNRLAEVLVK